VAHSSVPSGLLSPEAEQLIGGQYADRPHLRPILDAVLAAVPALRIRPPDLAWSVARG
jgi:hypothetical protein